MTDELTPKRPGADAMGCLWHWHVGNADLDQIDAFGLAALWGTSGEG
ncbi:MAG: hypothetical protein AB7O24_23940 [Kofleriaceae bacterium]